MGNDKRIGRIKSTLLFAPYILILTLFIVCVVLIFVTVRQKHKIADIENDINNISSQYTNISEQLISMDNTTKHLTTSLDEISKRLNTVDSSVKNIAESARENDGVKWPKKVYLTFDDGPSSNTERILEILDEYDVKGNFFVVGTQNENLKKLYKRIVDDGHVLGMHSYSHKYSEIYVSEEAFIEDLDKITKLIEDETGVKPTIYRFPGGSSNSVSRVPMSDLVSILDERGITYYDWNILSGDATNPMLPTDEIVENSLRDINQYEEAMILFHDLSNKTSTVEALPRIIEALLEQGISIAPINSKTMTIQHYTK